GAAAQHLRHGGGRGRRQPGYGDPHHVGDARGQDGARSARRQQRSHDEGRGGDEDRKSTRLNSSHVKISYAVFCLKKKKKKPEESSGQQTTTSQSCTCSSSSPTRTTRDYVTSPLLVNLAGSSTP